MLYTLRRSVDGVTRGPGRPSPLNKYGDDFSEVTDVGRTDERQKVPTRSVGTTPVVMTSEKEPHFNVVVHNPVHSLVPGSIGSFVSTPWSGPVTVNGNVVKRKFFNNHQPLRVPFQLPDPSRDLLRY